MFVTHTDEFVFGSPLPRHPAAVSRATRTCRYVALLCYQEPANGSSAALTPETDRHALRGGESGSKAR